MASYRRSKALKRCQRRLEGVWHDVPFDEPETRVRSSREGMIVVPMTSPDDPSGPTIPIADFIAAIRSKGVEEV